MKPLARILLVTAMTGGAAQAKDPAIWLAYLETAPTFAYPSSPPPAEAREPRAGGCLLSRDGADAAPSRACLGCHEPSSHGHAFDVDYERARLRRPGAYRRLDEVVRGGLLLPERRIQCVTCHDGRSAWGAKIAFPPGREPGRVQAVSLGGRTALAFVPAGSARPGVVNTAPLCNACHTVAD